jgi:hypothetical protein
MKWIYFAVDLCGGICHEFDWEVAALRIEGQEIKDYWKMNSLREFRNFPLPA